MAQNNKFLGQHWLRDRSVLNQIASLALPDQQPLLGANTASPEALQPTSQLLPSSNPPLCLEIGPGLGTLTSSLLRLFPKVIAVEFDAKLAHNLPGSFPGKNLTVVHQDFLKFDLSTITEAYVVAANIPYYITSPIINKLLSTPHPPQKIVLLIQKEVAERIVANPGHHTYLSLSVQNSATATLGPVVPRQLFTPPPKVDSQVLILHPHPPLLSESVLRFAKHGFSNPRKKLIKNLPYPKSVLDAVFSKLQLDPNLRPAALSHQDWQRLAALLAR